MIWSWCFIMEEILQYYREGMKYFAEGSLDKALSYLKIAATEGIDRPEVNDVIALTLIYKGDFEEAYRIFLDSSKKFNGEISQRYLSSIDELNGCIEKHNLAIDLIKRNKYDEALEHLLFIRNTGFRTINDDMLICFLYCTKKEYKNCKEILEEIHSINKEEVFYYKMKSYLDKKSYSRLKLYVASIAAIIIFSTVIMWRPSNNNYKAEEKGISVKQVAAANNNDIKTTSNNNLTSSNNSDSNYKILANLANDIMKEDLYDFAINNKDLDVSKLDDEGKKLYNQLEASYKSKAEVYFYKNGSDLYKNGNYKKAYEYLLIANDNLKGDYLDEHIIFYLAKSAKASGNGGVQYYRQYVNRYPQGCYREEALYDLAILSYQNNDKKEAEKYASIISEEYSSSMYNNNKIRSILQ